ncbi:MAG TPA: oligosaccharide flippase family protein [Longimicrobiaceae bacterium]|nr:oligosaccharide flippase family protein [Longimicrobiaceae bacterium]
MDPFPAAEPRAVSPAPPAARAPSLLHNVLANYAGNLVTAVLAIALVPVYVRILGIESYGLVGVYATLQSMLALLDMGLSTTLNREMAWRAARGRGAELPSLLRTLEGFFWPLAILVGAAVALGAPAIAGHWLRPEQVPLATATRAVALMGGVLALEWPFAFYSGGLLGIQRQVSLNAVVLASAVARSAGTLLVLVYLSPTIQAFFLCQLAAAALQTGLAAVVLWRSVRVPGVTPRMDAGVLRGAGGFAAGMSGITLLAVALTQADKVVLSRMLPLQQFGRYALAGVVATGLYRLVLPLFSALYPRFTELVSRGDGPELARLYHRGSQWISVALLPAALVLALFARQVLWLWTGDAPLADATWRVLALLVAGTALNGLMNLPYALQLAHGWTRLTLGTNAVAVLIVVPLVIVLTRRFGPAGAAGAWALLNTGYVLVAIQLMHRRLLPGEKWRWYGVDVGLPLLAACAVALVSRMLLPEGLGRLGMLGWVAATGTLTLGAAALAAPETRRMLIRARPAAWTEGAG